MEHDDGRHVRFNENDSNIDHLYRPQTVIENRDTQHAEAGDRVESGRRRSSSDPSGRGRQRPRLAVLRPRGNPAAGPQLAQIADNQRIGSTAFFNAPGGRNAVNAELADVLDVIDPEVSTLNNVTNIQNSLFIPSLGRLINRHPTYNLTRAPGRDDFRPTPQAPRRDGHGDGDGGGGGHEFQQGPHVEDQDYDFNFNHAVLPEGVSLEGWTKDEMAELNDHVRHMLHSRRSKFKRTMKAFGQYVKRPVGLFVTLYATLITLFGLAWVLFLIGWIYVGSRQLYIINIIDYVLVGLFAIMGDGLAPFRVVDTYHMSFIVHYHRKTWKLRKKLEMAKLRDKNDLPTDPELQAARDEVSVLTDVQEATLVHHQTKFAKSHTFYRPHETKTHFAFPQSFLIAIVLLLDLHSCLQISLGATTWGIDWKTRPPAITATILAVSITVNITAGILISVGGRKTRKKEVVERMFRQDLTREALKEIHEQGKKDGDTHKQIKAQRAIEDTRKSETLDEAVKSHVPVRESIEMGSRSRYDYSPRSPSSLKSPRPSTQSR
ncbi:hypothetical protein E0Z10_g2433 [Xylaria hypoxylon]|uniref:Integral membrane protein n=1 Tax=Xylaria hypoxylon TaxID=37992 RepID=A0A4Z0Z2B2_9PEZI|nr:hypothetical protein E0Z10_g2433 [Xylaria hypoxylon]